VIVIENLDSVVLCCLLGIAIWTDQKSHRIPNLLVLATLISGLIMQTTLNGTAGLSQSGLGVLTGFLVFLFPYLRGGMAAGDVKLIAACGAFLGPVGAVLAGGMATIIGALIGSSLIAYQRLRDDSLTVEQMLTTKFPFAASIAIGVAVVLAIRGAL
jgi:prepilin peptidase CpaA